MHAPFAQALVRILQAPHFAGASVERLQLIMTARSQSALNCAPRSPPLRSRDSHKLTLGDLEWGGCEGNGKLVQLPAAFYGESAAAYEQSHQGLDDARAAFLSMLRRHQQERSHCAIDRYMSFVPAGGQVSYERSVGYFINAPPQATVFAYLYEPTVVHAFGRCDCRNSNDNCNHT